MTTTTRNNIAIFILLLSTTSIAFAQLNLDNLENDPSIVDDEQNISFSIRLFDQRIYTPETPILIRASIRNTSPRAYHFKLADRRIFNVTFEARNELFKPLAIPSSLSLTRASNDRIFYRDIIIDPGSEYSFSEDLRDYIDIKSPGIYTVGGLFYPELIQSEGDVLRSAERLTIAVRPTDSNLDPIERQLEGEIAQLLRREDISPDRVVADTLRARRSRQWQRFFLYLDIPSLLRSDPARERRFLNLSESEQLAEIERYRQLLRSEATDEGISLIPDGFTILETRYTQRSGSVVAELRFDNGQFSEVKEYTYLLNRRQDSWEIYDYRVRNIGVE